MLDLADKIASVASAVLGLVGLVLAGYSLKRDRRLSGKDRQAAASSTMTTSASMTATATPEADPDSTPPSGIYIPPRSEWVPDPSHLPQGRPPPPSAPQGGPWGAPWSPGEQVPYGGYPQSPAPSSPTAPVGWDVFAPSPAARQRRNFGLWAGVALIMVAVGLAVFAVLV